MYVRTENTTCKCPIVIYEGARRQGGGEERGGGREGGDGVEEEEVLKKKGREKAITLREAHSLRHRDITLPSHPRHLATRNARAI